MSNAFSGHDVSNGQFLLQMAGEPGSGKSALAQAIGRVTSAVVLDKDIIKTAALHAGAEEDIAGAIAYEVFFGLTHSLLAMGHSVILDSPAYYLSIRERGQQLAEGVGARYYIIECCCDDREELARRLQQRERLASQPGELTDPSARNGTAALTEPRLVTHMSQPLSECVREAIMYLSHDPR